MGTPTFHLHQRVAQSWLSLASMVLGLVLSSSFSSSLGRWSGLAAVTAGALIAWFSHQNMREALGRAEADAQAWRAWQASSDDAVLVLGAPKGGWADWSPTALDAHWPVMQSANATAFAWSSQPNTPTPHLANLWPADALAPLLDTIRELTRPVLPGDDADATASATCEATLHPHNKGMARWWQHHVTRCGDRIVVQTRDITEAKAATKALHEREAFYRTLVDSLPVGVIARSTQPRTAGQYIVWNKHAADVLRVPTERILGSKGEHLLPERWLDQSDQQDLQVLRAPGLHEFTGLSLPTPKGERIIDLIKTPVYDADGDVDHILVIAQDVTEQRQAAEQLKLASRVVEETGDAVVVSDAVDRVVMVNPAFLRISGLRWQDAVGQNAELLGLPPLRESHLPGIIDALKEGQRWSGESRQTCSDGRQLDTWLSVSTVRNAKQAVTQHIRVFSDISVLKAHQRELAEQARHDSLTGLPNRRAFGERLNQAIARARRGSRALAVLFIDLDGFKAVNDQHGHAAGDELLKGVALRLQDCVRLTDTVCRLAGDEFTVILEGAGLPDEVQVVCQRILERLRMPHAIGGKMLVASPSSGAASFELSDTAESLCDRADGAMYAAKKAGKSGYVLAQGGDPATVALASVWLPDPKQVVGAN